MCVYVCVVLVPIGAVRQTQVSRAPAYNSRIVNHCAESYPHLLAHVADVITSGAVRGFDGMECIVYSTWPDSGRLYAWARKQQRKPDQ